MIWILGKLSTPTQQPKKSLISWSVLPAQKLSPTNHLAWKLREQSFHRNLQATLEKSQHMGINKSAWIFEEILMQFDCLCFFCLFFHLFLLLFTSLVTYLNSVSCSMVCLRLKFKIHHNHWTQWLLVDYYNHSQHWAGIENKK